MTMACSPARPKRAGRREDGHWGTLTERQKQVLPGHLSFCAILLYDYSDACRRSLLPFQWRSCRGADIAEVMPWLQAPRDSECVPSPSILRGLCEGHIATNDAPTIRELICPHQIDHLRLEITWPGGPPGSGGGGGTGTTHPGASRGYRHA